MARYGDRVTQLLKQRPDGVAFNHGLKKVLILEFTRAYDKPEDWADTTEAYKTSRYIPLLQLLRTSTGSVAVGWHGLAVFADAPFGFQ